MKTENKRRKAEGRRLALLVCFVLCSSLVTCHSSLLFGQVAGSATGVYGAGSGSSAVPGTLYSSAAVGTTGAGTSTSPYVNSTDLTAGIETQLTALTTGGNVQVSGYNSISAPITMTLNGQWLVGTGRGNLAGFNNEQCGVNGTIIYAASGNGLNIEPNPLSQDAIGYGGVKDILLCGASTATSTTTAIDINSYDQIHVDNVAASGFGTCFQFEDQAGYVDTPWLTNSLCQGSGQGIMSTSPGYVINAHFTGLQLGDLTGYGFFFGGTNNLLANSQIVRPCGTSTNCSLAGSRWTTNGGTISGNSFQYPGVCDTGGPQTGHCTNATQAKLSNLSLEGTGGQLVGNQFIGLLAGGVEQVDCHNGSGLIASGNAFDGSGQLDYLLESTCHDMVINDGNVRVVDLGARNALNGFSWNIGDPASAGNWNGHNKWAGLTIQDLTNNAKYLYTSPTNRILLNTPTTLAWVPLNEKTYAAGANPACTAAFTNALTNGSLIVVNVAAASGSIPTPTDTAGNIYADSGAGEVATNVSGYYVQQFSTINTHTTASNQVCFTNAGTIQYRIDAVEFAAPVSGAVDTYHTAANQTSGAVGTQNVSVGPMTTGTNGDLIIANTFFSSGPMFAGNGFVALTQPGGAAQPEWQVQTTAGAVTAAWSDGTASDKYGALVVAYKP